MPENATSNSSINTNYLDKLYAVINTLNAVETVHTVLCNPLFLEAVASGTIGALTLHMMGWKAENGESVVNIKTVAFACAYGGMEIKNLEVVKPILNMFNCSWLQWANKIPDLKDVSDWNRILTIGLFGIAGAKIKYKFKNQEVAYVAASAVTGAAIIYPVRQIFTSITQLCKDAKSRAIRATFFRSAPPPQQQVDPVMEELVEEPVVVDVMQLAYRL